MPSCVFGSKIYPPANNYSEEKFYLCNIRKESNEINIDRYSAFAVGSATQFWTN